MGGKEELLFYLLSIRFLMMWTLSHKNIDTEVTDVSVRHTPGESSTLYCYYYHCTETLWCDLVITLDYKIDRQLELALHYGGLAED